MTKTKESLDRESKKVERSIQIRFFIGITIPIILTVALLSSSLVLFPVLKLFESLPLILTILFAYFFLIPKWLGMPPFLSSTMLRHETALTFFGLNLLLAMIIDLMSAFSVSLLIQNGLSSLGLQMSSFLVSNLTYFISLTLGALAFLLRKSRQRVDLDLSWYVKMHWFKPFAYYPPPKMRKKGFPVLVKNRTSNTLVITNIHLKTIIGYPILVPYAVTKALLSDDPSLSHTVNADEDLEMPRKIEPKKGDIIYISWDVLERTARELSGKVDFSKTVAMSYISLYDEFAGKSWDTRAFHILTPLFVAKLSAFFPEKK